MLIQIQLNKNCILTEHIRENSTKFLGVHIDNVLSWKSHPTQINKTISCGLFMIKQTINVLPVNSLN